MLTYGNRRTGNPAPAPKSHPPLSHMAYQVYFANLADEIQALTFMLLRIKSDAGQLEPGEQELLDKLRGPLDQLPPPELMQRDSHPMPRRGGSRRRYSNGRSHNNNYA